MTPTYPGTGQPMTAGVLADGSTINHLAEHGRTIGAWENVKHYGAYGDGSHDDTTAIQAAIDAAVGGPMSGTIPTPARGGFSGTGAVYIPAGFYKITAPLVVRGINGLKLWGAGSASTYLRVSGTMTQAVQLLGASILDLRGFVIEGIGGYAGSGHVTYGITWDWTPAETTGSSYRSTFHDIWVTNLDFKYGWGIGTSSGNYDVSNGEWTHCQVYGNNTMGSANTTQWQSAFQIGNGTSGNVLNFYFADTHVGFIKTGYYVNSVANVAVNHGDASQVENLIYKIGPGEVLLRDTRIEDSWRIADSLGGAAYTSHLSVHGLHWSQALTSAADGQLIRWNYPGSVEVSNSSIDYDSFAGRPMKIVCSVAPANGWVSVTLRNVSWYVNSADPPAAIVVPVSTTHVRAVFEGVTTTLNNGAWAATYQTQIMAWNYPSELAVGNNQATGAAGTDDLAVLRLTHPGDGTSGAAALSYDDGGTQKWWLYKTASSDILFLRDMTNARMHGTFQGGASNTAAITELASELRLLGPLNHDGTTVGFFGHAPSAQPSAYTVTNPTTDRGLNVTGDTLAQVAEVLGTLIADLQTLGIIG